MADPAVDRRRRQLAGEVAHWRAAAHSLGDLDTIAAPAAWAAVERYLDTRIRQRLTGIANSVAGEADQLASAVTGALSNQEVAHLRRRLLELRRRYLRAETVIDFYCEAINTRTTPRLGRILRGLDSVAVDSMVVTLRPLGIEAPPVLTYLDKGLGAAILRAGVRLWDDNALSPAAAIKITRHNLLRPTSLIHESGHQVAHLCGWNAQLADPRHASPRALSELAERAGASLYTSSYLERHESLRIVAWNTLQAAQSPVRSPMLARQLQGWLEQLGREPLATAA